MLTDERIRQTARVLKLSFGEGVHDVYSVPLTLGSSSKPSRVGVEVVPGGRGWCSPGWRTWVVPPATPAPALLQGAEAKLTPEGSCGCSPPTSVGNSKTRRRRAGVGDQRVVLVDGSTLSMPDTPANQQAYPQMRSQRPGVGFPILRWVALLGLATGVVLDSAFGPYRGKQTGETALLRSLLSSLRRGDVVLADRYYCSYWMVGLLHQQGGEIVFRQHQLRRTDFRRGRRLDRDDHLVTWTKPRCPTWMDAATYDAFPETLQLREMRTRIATPGCRVRELVVVTSLCDAHAYSKEEVLDLYHERWHAELDLRSLKTHMKMEILRCKTPEMVRKEIWAHLLAYNLVRKVMAQAATEHIPPRQISFKGMQTLNEFRTSLLQATAAQLPAMSSRILAAIARHRVGDRPDRYEPRTSKGDPGLFASLPRAENGPIGR